MDALDRKILNILQRDATLPVERIAEMVHSSKSPVWTRIRKLKDRGIIKQQVAVLDAAAVGQPMVFFVAIRTAAHAPDWLERFHAAVAELSEIQEAHRLAGDVDYLLKVRVRDAAAFDDFYKRLIARVELFSVTSSLSMETLKETTAIAFADEPD